MNRYFFTALFIAAFLAWAGCGSADDHGRSGKGFKSHGSSLSGQDWGKHSGASRHHGRDKGNETTGEIAGWAFAVANLTVALSLLIKAVNRFAPIGPDVKDRLQHFNRRQKKLLIPFHCYANVGILGIALLHWALSRCRATFLPELALICIACLIGMGIILRYKLFPASVRKAVFKLHTNPFVAAAPFLILYLGHLAVN